MNELWFDTDKAVTAIHMSKHRISSDLRSESHVGVVSTGVGDHLGIQRAVILFFILLAVTSVHSDRASTMVMGPPPHGFDQLFSLTFLFSASHCIKLNQIIYCT